MSLDPVAIQVDTLDVIARAIAVGGLLGAALYAAFSDLQQYRIPNWTSALAALSFVLYAVAAGMDSSTFAWHAGVGAIVLAVGFALFAFGTFGGGDAKLLSAVSLWAGPRHELIVLFVIALAGGILALAVLIFRRFPISQRLTAWKQMHSEERGIPYGVAIAVGAVALLFRM